MFLMFVIGLAASLANHASIFFMSLRKTEIVFSFLFKKDKKKNHSHVIGP